MGWRELPLSALDLRGGIDSVVSSLHACKIPQEIINADAGRALNARPTLLHVSKEAVYPVADERGNNHMSSVSAPLQLHIP